MTCTTSKTGPCSLTGFKYEMFETDAPNNQPGSTGFSSWAKQMWDKESYSVLLFTADTTASPQSTEAQSFLKAEQILRSWFPD